MLSLFGKTRWAVFECLTGAFTALERLPFEIGSDDGADLRLNGSGVAGRHCAIARVKGRSLCLVRRDPEARLCVNGATTDSADLVTDQDYSVEVGSHLLLVRGGKKLEAWRAELDH